MNDPFIISGPSGVGKSHLAKYLQLNFNCKRIVPITTRAMRPQEIQNVDYKFVSEDEYDLMKLNEELIMSNQLFGARYGFSKVNIQHIIDQGLTPITELYTPTLPQFLSIYPHSKKIFLMPNSEDLLIKRMGYRNETEDNIQIRLQEAKKEIRIYLNEYQDFYDECYEVNEFNFQDITRDIAILFLTEDRIIQEGATQWQRR